LPEPVGRLRRLRGFISGILILVFLLSAALIVNVLQLLSLPIMAFSSAAYRQINRVVCGTWGNWCHLAAERLHGVRFLFSGDELPVGENAIAIINHQTMADAVALLAVARHRQAIGNLKWIAKDMIKYVPGIGWGVYLLGCIMVKRDWAEDRDNLHRVFGNVLKHRVPLWLVSFAEGTRLTCEKLEKSRQYAERRGLVPLRHLLQPRTKGFVATVQTLRGHVTAVYDVTLGYPDGVPSLWQWTKGHVPRVQIHLRRFPIDELPREDGALADWLQTCFQTKDTLLHTLYHQGTFPPTATVEASSDVTNGSR